MDLTGPGNHSTTNPASGVSGRRSPIWLSGPSPSMPPSFSPPHSPGAIRDSLTFESIDGIYHPGFVSGVTVPHHLSTSPPFSPVHPSWALRTPFTFGSDDEVYPGDSISGATTPHHHPFTTRMEFQWTWNNDGDAEDESDSDSGTATPTGPPGARTPAVTLKRPTC
jgi:hypothetical protein